MWEQNNLFYNTRQWRQYQTNVQISGLAIATNTQLVSEFALKQHKLLGLTAEADVTGGKVESDAVDQCSSSAAEGWEESGYLPLQRIFLVGFAQILGVALEESGWVQTHAWPRHC